MKKENHAPDIVTTITQIPEDVMDGAIVPSLPASAMLNLTTSCSFFLNRFSDLRRRTFASPSFRISIGACHHLILYPSGDVFSSSVQLGDLTHPSTLQQVISLMGVKFKQVVAGYGYSHLICKDGRLFSFGDNSLGQLGLGHVNYQPTPERGTSLAGVKFKQVVSGGFYSLLIGKKGDLFSFGINNLGQLGLGHIKNQSTPQQVTSLIGIKVEQVAAGRFHSLILCENDNVFSFGGNDSGQLGLGIDNWVPDPRRVDSFLPPGMKPQQVVAGGSHSFILCKNGNLFSFGNNSFGQLGLGHTDDQKIPQRVVGVKVKQVVAGDDYTLILCGNGEILSCGNNNFGQLGLGHTEPSSTLQKVTLPAGVKPTKLGTGGARSLIFCEGGEVFGFGHNTCSLLGPREISFQSVPQKVICLSEEQVQENTRDNLSNTLPNFC